MAERYRTTGHAVEQGQRICVLAFEARRIGSGHREREVRPILICFDERYVKAIFVLRLPAGLQGGPLWPV